MSLGRLVRYSLSALASSMLVASVSLLAWPSGAAAELAPFGHACKAENGVRFCPTETLAERVPTFDGVPLDADVTLPLTGNGPFPTVVMLHGWDGNKTNFESNSPAGDYNNVYFAQHGYAVLNYTQRGWGNSCGTEASRENTPGCDEGWDRLADQRYEARDAQYLLGLLADEHIVKPKRIATTGISYGGGISVELAYLKNRIRLPNGEFAPWTSPKGKHMEIAAAYARWPWSDLVDALLPNGRFLNTEIAPFGQSYEPIGVQLESYEAGLYEEGETGGYFAAPGQDPEADQTKWFALTNAGEPYEEPEAEAIAKQVYTYHMGYSIPFESSTSKPAPLLMESGFTDELFPPEQSLRVYNQVRARKGYIALMFGDLGHSDGSNRAPTVNAFTAEGAEFIAAKLKHEGRPPRAGSVRVFTETCTSTPEIEYRAKKWSKLARHSITFASSEPQIFTSAGGNATIAAEFDPIVNSNACKEVKAETEPNTANYTFVSKGFTLLGMPTVTATINTVGPYGEIPVRLWDILPSGEQRLITRGIYRLTDNETGTITFQLHGNAYPVAAGDKVELQLLGRDAPYYRASNGTFSVEVKSLSVSLPTS